MENFEDIRELRKKLGYTLADIVVIYNDTEPKDLRTYVATWHNYENVAIIPKIDVFNKAVKVIEQLREDRIKELTKK